MNFEKAHKHHSHERARLLHAGVQAVAPFLGSVDDRGDDPVLAFYPSVVAEIRTLDSAEDGSLGEIYEAQQRKRDQWIALNESTFGKLDEFSRNKDYKGAIAFLDDALQHFTTPDIQWRLERSRQIYLEWDDQHEAALENAGRLLNGVDRAPKEREWLLDREAFNLFNLGRVREGIAHCDQRILDARDSPQKQRRLLSWKAQMVLNRSHVRPAESIRAWTEYRQATEPGSEEWLEASVMFARKLHGLGKHQEALTLQREVLKTDPTNPWFVSAKPWVLLDVAKSYIALSEFERAQESLRNIETTFSTVSDRPSDKEAEKQLRAAVSRIRRELLEKKGETRSDQRRD